MVFTIINISEILIVNLFHVHIVLEKKYSNRFTFFVLFLFTTGIVAIFSLTNFIVETTKLRAVLIGLSFIVPLFFLYKTRFNKLLSSMIYCWGYTIILNTFSYGIVKLIQFEQNETMYIFLLQTALILLSISCVFAFTKNQYRLILDKANSLNQKLLIVLGFSIFFSYAGIRYFVDPSLPVFLVLSVTTLFITIAAYLLLYSSVQTSVTLTSTRLIAFQDSLTGIKNRHSLFKDINILIEKAKPFSIFFLDLDNLKRVNDEHSHSVGDAYLKDFATVLTNKIEGNGEVYRFAGDEFVCLITNQSKEICIQDLEKKIIQEMNSGNGRTETYGFTGFSIGIANFPEDGKVADDLINHADLSMYGQKRSRKIRRINGYSKE